MQIKASNKEYINELLNKGVRELDRGFLEYRVIKAEHNRIPHAEGSVLVDIGNTKVLTGVKLDIGSPLPDKPEEGTLFTTAELLPLASADYETGPPRPEAIEFARVVDRGIRAAEIIDTEALFIEEDKVWNVYVDIYVLNFDGNLFDAGTLSAAAALLTAKQPRYEDKVVIREGALPRLKTKGIVTSCTYAKIGNKILLDPSGNEEELMSARLTIANDEDNIRAMQKGLSGAFSLAEVDKAIDTTFERSADLRGIVKRITGE